MSDKKTRKLLCVIAGTAVVLAASLAAWHWGRFQSVEQRLAHIEAERAIADSENAATLYVKIPACDISDRAYDSYLFGGGHSRHSESLTLWRREEKPKWAQWMQRHQHIIKALFEATAREKCVFPIMTARSPDALSHFDQNSTLNKMDHWTVLLCMAIQNDIAEGRLDAAIAKLTCTLRCVDHLYQQPGPYFIHGNCIETDALQIAAFIVASEQVTDSQLDTVQAALLNVEDRIEEELATLEHVEDIARSMRPPLSVRIREWSWATGVSSREAVKVIRPAYKHTLSFRRGCYITVALRRHKLRSGDWPESLDDVSPMIDAEALIDPQNGDAFVYRLTEGGFTLYSKGPNGVDDGGPGVSDDRVVWSSQKTEPNAKEESVDDEQ